MADLHPFNERWIVAMFWTIHQWTAIDISLAFSTRIRRPSLSSVLISLPSLDCNCSLLCSNKLNSCHESSYIPLMKRSKPCSRWADLNSEHNLLQHLAQQESTTRNVHLRIVQRANYHFAVGVLARKWNWNQCLHHVQRSSSRASDSYCKMSLKASWHSKIVKDHSQNCNSRCQNNSPRAK